jgi:hypothetical protein
VLHQPEGAYLMHTGRHLVVIECGRAFQLQPNHRAQAGCAAGYTHEQMDIVLLTSWRFAGTSGEKGPSVWA